MPDTPLRPETIRSRHRAVVRMTERAVIRTMAGILVFGIMAACGGGDSGAGSATPSGPTTPPPPPAPVASVTVSPDSSDVAIGGSVQLTVTPRDAQGTALTGRTVSWSSTDATRATVSASGMVTTVAAGRAQITATVEGQSASAIVRVRGMADTLPGDPAALAVSAIPRRVASTRAEDYRSDHPDLGGLSVSFNTVMLLIQPATTIGQLNTLLRGVDAQVVGGLPGAASAPGMLVLRLPTKSHTELTEAMRVLRASPLVRTVVPEVLLEETAVSRGSADAVDASWRWGTLVTTMAQGNWGLKLMRVPQLWNLNDFVRRGGGIAVTGVFDGGFGSHPDLVYGADITPSDAITTPKGVRHGTHVAGTIGATFDNGVGVDGVNPFARLVVRGGAGVANMITGLGDLLITETGAGRPRVVNVSLAYNFGDAKTNTTVSAAARELADSQGLMVEMMLAAVQRFGGPLPVIVVAAGNDRAFFPGQQARYATPFANASIARGVKSIIVVEAIQLGDGGATSQADFSNDGGQLSAPGVAVMSTVPADGAAVRYSRLSGTSMAAPNVAGVVGYLLALDPAFPAPTLTTNPMLDLLRASALPASGASPRIDAFSAALELDRIRGGDRVLRGLLDLDDGTPDGNTRVNMETGQVVVGDAAGARDGKVDMRDFRRWRDALLQAENPQGLALNGAPDHPKRDLNGDRTVGTAAEENAFPRGDFNGDGRLSRDATVPVAGVFGSTRLTDLQVFQRVFDDAVYARDDLPQLVESGDLEFHPVACLAVPGAALVRASLRRGEEETSFRVLDLTPSAPKQVRTEAVFAGGYRARLSVRDAQNEELAYHEQQLSLAPGEDRRIEPECFRLDVDVIVPQEVSAGAAQPLSIKVTRVRPRLDLRNPAANADVTVTVIGGSVTNAFGTTNAAGEFNTTVVPAAGPPSMTIVIEIDTENGGTSTRVTRPIAGALPCGAGVNTSAFGLGIGADSTLHLLNGVGKTDRRLLVSGTFTQFVDLRRLCEVRTDYTVTGTFLGGLRLDGIESVGEDIGGNGNVTVNASGGILSLERIRGVEHISLPRLRYVGIPLLSGANGMRVSLNPDLLTLSVGRDVPLLQITGFRVTGNQKLTTVTVFPEMRRESLARWGFPAVEFRVDHVEVRDNPALTTATFGKVTTRRLTVVNNPALRTLTLGAGSVLDSIAITGNPLLQSLQVPCNVIATSSITIRGSPRLDVAALNATAAACWTAQSKAGAVPVIITR